MLGGGVVELSLRLVFSSVPSKAIANQNLIKSFVIYTPFICVNKNSKNNKNNKSRELCLSHFPGGQVTLLG